MNIVAWQFCSRAAARISMTAFAFALSACSPEEVTLVRFGTDAESPDDADVPAESLDSGVVSEPHADASASSELDARTRPDSDAGAGARSCSGNEDCSSRELCSMIGCNAKKGTCVPVPPFFCNGEQNPTCGCDGLVYFNDCMRQEARVSMDPTCLSKRSCDRNNPCPGRASCSYLYKGDRTCRQAPPIRECWVLPIVCSPTGGSAFAPCDAVSTECLTLCDAIASELPFTELSLRCGRPPGGGSSNITFMQ
jgi:hypothetical protein